MTTVLVVSGVLLVVAGTVILVDQCLNIEETWKKIPSWKRFIHTATRFVGGMFFLRIIWLIL